MIYATQPSLVVAVTTCNNFDEGSDIETVLTSSPLSRKENYEMGPSKSIILLSPGCDGGAMARPASDNLARRWK
ncbi:hypothetical protein NC653_040175 [Populus alba x Populus x berolinensis]|uniref:Uncharacterized protein n=1 Tax=Populus alba x Populus x berolinensis TaxID=444605 RepID=A0AAD6PRC1_9ROSI|nr:hypothetical protein NC653_040175 [Populus alba x Populus x berolinensis]